jgi:hypothetical protein
VAQPCCGAGRAIALGRPEVQGASGHKHQQGNSTMPRYLYSTSTMITTVSMLTAICFAVMVLAVAMIAKGDDKLAPDNNQPVSFWMQKKLEYSQNILAGIANADFDKVVANAQSMRNLSKVEGFVRAQAPGYRAQLHIFEESADEIIRQGKKDNVEGAALAFTQLTISCVNCHKHLRAETNGK